MIEELTDPDHAAVIVGDRLWIFLLDAADLEMGERSDRMRRAIEGRPIGEALFLGIDFGLFSLLSPEGEPLAAMG